MTALIHGDAGTGKSWDVDTLPRPRLILDAEGGSKFLPSAQAGRMIVWNPQADAPPEPTQEWDSCRVSITSIGMMDRVFQWLNSGKHPFESLGVDQLTEIQSRMKGDIAGTGQMTQPNWGDLLRSMDDHIRRMRDLVEHPIKPLQAVVFVSATKMYDGKYRPMMDGQMRDKLPYTTDLVGWQYTKMLDGGEIQHAMLIKPIDPWVAKDRTHMLSKHYGQVITNPNIVEMLEVMNA